MQAQHAWWAGVMYPDAWDIDIFGEGSVSLMFLARKIRQYSLYVDVTQIYIYIYKCAPNDLISEFIMLPPCIISDHEEC